MKLLVITGSTSTGNIIKNSLQQANVTDLPCTIVGNPGEAKPHLDEETVVLADWEGTDPALHTAQVKQLKEMPDGAEVPILLLCTKQAAATTFPGMKAGACGVVNKPVDTELLLKAVANAMKSRKSGKKQNVNVEFINPFIESTRTVLKTMCSMNVERKRLFLKNDHQMFGDISGVMGLSGSASGSVVISLPKNLAILLYSRMLGEEPGTELTQEICDGVGELINMISGQAKASLTKTKYHFQISIPTVVTGSCHEITHKQGTPNIVVLFETEEGETFAIQVCLSPNDEED